MEKKRKLSMAKKIGFATLVLIISFILSWQLGLFRKNCDDNRECFNEALAICKQAKFYQLKDYNYYSYKIEGTKKGKCSIYIKIEKMAEGASIGNIEKFEGKGMSCQLPLEMLNATTIENVNGLLFYCSGPLKEAVYEVIIEKLYGIVLNNIGDVVVEMRDVLKEVK